GAAVLGQSGADRIEVADLRGELGEARAQLRLALAHLFAARGARGVVRRKRFDEPPQDRLGVADERDRRAADALRLLGIGIDADHRELVVDAPLLEAVEQARADAQHDLRLAPQIVAAPQRDAQPRAGAEDAAPPPEPP